MIKALLTYFLSLSILLLSGYSQLSACAHELSTYYSPATNSIKSVPTSVGAAPHEQALLSKPPSSGTEKHLTIDTAQVIEEKEDDESTHFKKYVASSHYFTTLFHALSYEYFLHYLKTRLSSYKPFSYGSSSESLYLVFRVFRI